MKKLNFNYVIIITVLLLLFHVGDGFPLGEVVVKQAVEETLKQAFQGDVEQVVDICNRFYLNHSKWPMDLNEMKRFAVTQGFDFDSKDDKTIVFSQMDDGRLEIAFEKLVDKSEMPNTFGSDAVGKGLMKLKVKLPIPSNDEDK